MCKIEKNIFIKMQTIVLALVVFFSSTGFQLSAHYCSGQLKSYRFYGKAEACKHEPVKTKSCHKHVAEEPSSEKNTCCDYEDISIDHHSYEASSLLKISLDHDMTYILLKPMTFVAQQYLVDLHYSNTFYRPPPIDDDIPILHQSFLL